ncbi:nucleotidyltransferase [Kurthia senegalensis]|uniref:nucleotidyltransferase n=1 Tax=Kurthia senegalensis TaxID=1033740 RepID=UPI0002892405|nr:nucleotidyltransferase [Kurthia senegalensis]
MNATGVIVEYNPFHNGHLHHIKQSKILTDADIVIAVMSGHFLQRGEPSFVNKWLRTKMALLNGVDLVIELPYAFSTAPAVDFAKGGIALLDALGCQSIAFGSEEGQIEPFLAVYSAIETQTSTFQLNVQQAVKNGVSYAKALNSAYAQLATTSTQKFADLSLPNNILGYHYVEQIFKQKSEMKPFTIPRVASGYHDAIHEGTTIQSATGIRQAVFEQSLQTVETFMPASNYALLQQTNLMNWDRLYPLLRYELLRTPPEQLAQFAEVTEGIEHLLIKAAKTCETFQTFMERIKSKRYTWTRLQRMLTHIVTGFTSEQLSESQRPSYARILGMTTNGQKYISTHKKQFKLPLISRVASFEDAMLAQDIKATDIYLHASNESIGLDYKYPPIRL